MSKQLLATIGHGDRVTIVDRFGQERTGKAVMRSTHGGWVLDMGGKHGTPGIADETNITKVRTNGGNPSKAYKRPRTGRMLGAGTEHYVVSGPQRWKRSVHTSKTAALKSARTCARQFPNAVCKVTEGLPGMQRLVAECNRDDCDMVSGFGKRRRRSTKKGK